MPGKIKNFGWRALRGVMPCKAILANRHVIPEGGCPVCHNGAEDIKHLIFTCDRARAGMEVDRSLGEDQTPTGGQSIGVHCFGRSDA